MNGNSYLTRKTFFWIMGILIMVITTVMGYTIGKVDKVEENFNHNFTTVTNEISAMKVDIGWIKDYMSRDI
ncbi:hypothetical protein LCGC14_2262530 [marine sediment metagenome]|uniref:Uncharacterized protein n=1 Tax=marine sediment metagenome TaxID=412755 RepID=A0A0F9FBM1_9ZZZZ